MTLTENLIADVANARKEYLALIAPINEQQASWKPANDSWNIVDITEHLFWAEQGGIYGMWKTLLAIREGNIPKTYESAHKEFSIEKVIEQTWREKEVVPAVAAPRLGGTLAFWRASLHSLQAILEEFGAFIKDEELRLKAHPHPISGDLDFQQRIEFLRFHINRHKEQVANLIADYNQKNS